MPFPVITLPAGEIERIRAQQRKSNRLAMDTTARTYDDNGRLHIAKSHITKATVNPYYGSEVPGFELLGLDPGKIYYFLRSPEELEKGAASFARLPILKKHKPILTTKNIPTELIVGTIGSDVNFSAPYIDADVCIWDATAIAGIESDQIKEFSCAYRWLPAMQSGEFEGTHYDGIMTEIRGDHMAIVEDGRAGPDVIAADGNPFPKVNQMKMTKLGKALFVALSALSPKLAQDSALPALVGLAEKKSFKKEEVRPKLIALDSDLPPQQLDNVIDALLDVEQSPEPVPAVDAEPTDKRGKLSKMLAGKVSPEELEQILGVACAVDAKEGSVPSFNESPTEHITPADHKTAMDELRKDMKEANEARRLVRPVVGEVIAQDSAAEIYEFALDHLKVDHKDVTDVPALKSLLTLATSRNEPVAAIAQDAAGLATKFPAATRFRLA